MDKLKGEGEDDVSDGRVGATVTLFSTIHSGDPKSSYMQLWLMCEAFA